MAWLINASQLDKFRKNQKNVIILDVSWFLPTAGRDAKQEFLDKHIIGARFLDFAPFHDLASPLPNMLMRDEAVIGQQVGAHGITNDFKIIFYDNSDLHTSSRALWMFKVFGHNPNQLYILDGGLDAWVKYGGKVESGEPRNVASKPYSVNFEARLVRTLVQMKNNLHHPQEQVIDLRHPVRYAGGPESRAGLRSGHIPGSYCFPFITMFEKDGRFKSPDQLRKQLLGIGLDFSVPMVSTCGSGITAPILNFILDLLGLEHHSVYDGSWSEWGAEQLYAGEVDLSERPIKTSISC
ncbi:MAG: sulfurtransferase [Gammaproteobacteria bacterium]